MKENESQEVKSRLGTISRPIPVSCSTRTEDRIREKAMGTFIRNITSSEPNRIRATNSGDRAALIAHTLLPYRQSGQWF